MGGEERAMELRKKTRPSREAKGRAHESNQIVTPFGAMRTRDAAMATAFALFVMLALPRLMWLLVAPMKGWM